MEPLEQAPEPTAHTFSQANTHRHGEQHTAPAKECHKTTVVSVQVLRSATCARCRNLRVFEFVAPPVFSPAYQDRHSRANSPTSERDSGIPPARGIRVLKLQPRRRKAEDTLEIMAGKEAVVFIVDCNGEIMNSLPSSGRSLLWF